MPQLLLIHMVNFWIINFGNLILLKFLEVARTRLREEGDKYRRFFQTIFLVYREEGLRNGLYRGLATQLIRKYF